MAHRDTPVWDKDWSKDKRKPKKFELPDENKEKEKRKKDSSRRRSKRRRDNYYYDDED